MIHREHIEWHDIWVTGADDDTMPRALFVGDSIARSYFPHVEEELRGIFLCARMTTSTCVADKAVGARANCGVGLHGDCGGSRAMLCR